MTKQRVKIDFEEPKKQKITPVSDNLPLKEQIIGHLKNVFDPELSVNIYDLGLIYNIELSEDNRVKITMTLTSAFCPAADWIVDQVKQAALKAKGVISVEINLVMDPPWDKSKMSESARLESGLL
jgi:metal-sulfur cluster biosynthetic enzyme